MSGFTPEMREKSILTRRQAAEERRARQEAAGIPESPRFGGDPEAEKNPVLDCHVGGVLVRDMPIEAQTRILYQQTDEGIAEYNAGKSEHRVSVVSEDFDKSLKQRKDDVLDRGMDNWEARDPLKEVYDKHISKGMRGKFLSQRRVKENGGTGDYEVVKNTAGDPVMVRGMVLGQMPAERAEARNRHYRNRSNRLISEMTDRYKREGGKTAVADEQ